jgi:hypothetical protein
MASPTKNNSAINSSPAKNSSAINRHAKNSSPLKSGKNEKCVEWCMYPTTPLKLNWGVCIEIESQQFSTLLGTHIQTNMNNTRNM